MVAPGKDLSSDSVLYGRLAAGRTGLDAWRDRCRPDEANCGIRDRGLFGKLHGWAGTRDWNAFSAVIWAHQQLPFWKVADADDKMYRRGRPDSLSAHWVRRLQQMNPGAQVGEVQTVGVSAAAEIWYRQSHELHLVLPEDQYQRDNPSVEYRTCDGTSGRVPGAHLLAVEKLTMLSSDDACQWRLAFLPDPKKRPRLVYFDSAGRPWGSVAIEDPRPAAV